MRLLEEHPAQKDLSFEPIFFRINKTEDREQLELLLEKTPHLEIHDQISTQLDDLVKSMNPDIKKPDREKLDELKRLHLGETPEKEYGVWIYYPWSRRLIHALDREEFIEVRTNRNRYKLTREEQSVLSKKKIGIVGLSVGQSIALTLAMERTCGELRLADYDTAELSNLNRLRTGIHHIGLEKTIIAAREIAEIDPFIKIKIFNDGLHKDNMDAFFLEDGALDLFIEVCDGLDIKIESRYKARSLRIPTIMDTNDRGMIDIERFDLEPDRAILHGLADGLNPDNIKNLTNEEKIPFVLRMIGAESISIRLKASMLEVEQSINTWPQLASSVTLGGALTTDVSRRVLLDQFHASGRYYLDMEQLIKDEVSVEAATEVALPQNPYEDLTPTEVVRLAEEYLFATTGNYYQLNEEQVDKLMDAAVAAPSAGNNQPWKWTYSGGLLFLVHDKKKSWSWGDYFEMGSHMGLGAALENINLQAINLNLNATFHTLPMDQHPNLIAAISFQPGVHQADEIGAQLSKHIFERYTNRKVGDRKPLPAGFYEQLQTISEAANGIHTYVIEEQEQLVELADIIAECDKIRLLDQLGHEEFFHEIRWTEEEALQSRDGIELRAVDITPSEVAGFKVARDWNAMQLIADWDKGNAFKKLSTTAVKNASGVVIFTIDNFSHRELIEVGRCVQRSWIFANQQGVSVHPMLSPAFFFNRMLHGKGAELSPRNLEKLERLRSKFLNLLPAMNASESEVFIMKFSLAEDIGVRAIRKTKDQIFINY